MMIVHLKVSNCVKPKVTRFKDRILNFVLVGVGLHVYPVSVLEVEQPQRGGSPGCSSDGDDPSGTVCLIFIYCLIAEAAVSTESEVNKTKNYAGKMTWTGSKHCGEQLSKPGWAHTRLLSISSGGSYETIAASVSAHGAVGF